MQRALPVVSTLALAFAAMVSPAHAATPKEQAVLAPIQTMFDGMAKHDKATLLSAVLADGSVALLRDGKVHRMTLGEFAEKAGTGSGKIEERIHDPLVRIDNDIAMVWAPYEFLSDGKVRHCGTDVFNLVQQEGRWLIAGVADNGRDNCPAR
ncbi:MAG TPA: nuclear transport factor 2 family protein [Luteibacter sp.]|jgi:hypothetical protein|nr:nuclear transport factor 2 family protein [Luteibacter sp.]